MKRSDLLGLLRYAGYHDDIRAFVRLRVEQRISPVVAGREWRKGQSMRAMGEKCSCRECNPPAPRAV